MTFPGSRAPGWRLKSIGKYGLPTSLDVPKDGLVIGRDPWSTCRITGEQWGMVSRVHSRLELIDEKLFVHDCDSSNGTFVNEERTESAELHSGDVLQLGPEGPKFLIFHAVGLESTTVVEGRAIVKATTRQGVAGLGDTAMVTLKRALGLDEVHANASRVESSQKRHFAIAGAALCTLALAGVVSYSHIWNEGKKDVQIVDMRSKARAKAAMRESERRINAVQRETEQLQDANLELATRLEESLLTFGRHLEDRIANSYVAREAWDCERLALEDQRATLEMRLKELRGASDVSAGETAQLAERLEKTIAELARFNPQEIEAQKLVDLLHVRSAVVMIESRVIFREPTTKRLLHSSLTSGGESAVNLRNEGFVLDQRSSGSGFVISPSGYIMTNAHVAVPSDFVDPLEITEGNEVIPEVELEVVFSGSSERIPAQLILVDDSGDQDFALIKIEPFEGMALLELADLDASAPEPGSEVYLCGFPLGTFAVQEGDRVIASTLKGILSRSVGPYVQIDAGVHPGLSGGPVTNAQGKVIGIVCSVQATPMGEIAAAIGYALPISSARSVLPADALR